MTFDVVIVGAGHGGAQAAIALRQKGFGGSIAIFGEEADLPYERPPLSKDYFSGERTFDRILIRPATFWDERDIHIVTGSRVTAVDPVARTIGFDNGSTVGYQQLIWATGGHARKLACAGAHLAGVHSVRSRADVDKMLAELSATMRVAVVGGGYIGLEAAAVLVKAGKQVTVLEAQDRVLARVAGVALSRFYEAEHRAHGVDMQLGVQVDCVEGSEGRATGVRLSGGAIIPAEMVIVGIGIVPAIEPLLAAGARGGNGVAVDEHCRTSLPHVFAIGDCAMHANAFADGLPIRLESVQNATDMAMTVARAIVGSPEPYHAVPWFWSNQYDLRLQTVGLSAGHDSEILRGDPSQRSFSIVYLKEGRVVAIDAVNAMRDYVQGKALVIAGARADPVRLADHTIALKDLV